MHAPMIVRKQSRTALAEKLVSNYYTQMFAAASHRSGRVILYKFSDLPPREQELFLKAADSCIMVAATAKEYIEAQFEQFAARTYYRRRKRHIVMPQPNHLHGITAQARYFTYKAGQDTRAAMVEPEADPTFKCEERKLAGMVKLFRREASEILVLRPAEFTRKFLEHKGVWSLVEDKYHEQMDE